MQRLFVFVHHANTRDIRRSECGGNKGAAPVRQSLVVPQYSHLAALVVCCSLNSVEPS
jgi:hypothetical protein